MSLRILKRSILTFLLKKIGIKKKWLPSEKSTHQYFPKQLKETIKQLRESHTWKGEEETNYQS